MAKKVLVVVDMQKDFTTGVLGNAECVAAISQVVDVIENGKYDTYIATRDTHTENYMNTREGEKLPVIHCVEGTEGWNLVPEVAEALEKAAGKEVIMFDKPTFGSVSLGEYFREQYGDGSELEVDFVGVCTGICVISNVSVTKAFCPESKVRVIAKACACVTPDTHETALNAMKTFQVDVI